MASLNRCNFFRAFKGKVQPTCSDSACWDEFFINNPGKVLAGALALQKLGAETVVKAQGAEYAEMRRSQQVAELIAGKRQLLDDKALVAHNRGTKYLKMLTAFLKRHPVDLSDRSEHEVLATA